VSAMAAEGTSALCHLTPGTSSKPELVQKRASRRLIVMSAKPTSGQLPGRRSRRSAVGQDYLRHGDLSTPICARLARENFRVADNSAAMGPLSVEIW
jgi:hypothetical protein